MRKLKNILVTGGCGFIGSNFIKLLFSKKDFTGRIINVDSLTYAASPEFLQPFVNDYENKRYFFEKADICDTQRLTKIFSEYNIDTVVHFAAESHVDNSIKEPSKFIQTNINGTFSLLECAKNFWNCNLKSENSNYLFHYISTDEVYGSLSESGYFSESSCINPKSPYSASKASGEMLCFSYYNTYGLPVTVSNCSNNFGPGQHQEKLIPHTIHCILEGNNIPVYGNGKNVRDWIFVEDHNEAVWTILKKGSNGQRYNIGGDHDISNLELLDSLIKAIAPKLHKTEAELKSLIEFVKDRPGHDFRYAINCEKIKSELGWSRQEDFDTALKKTIDWYLSCYEKNCK